MKKLMILAVAAIALVACSKEFDTNKSANEGKAISFGTWSETLTKARATADDNTAFEDGEAFDVFGFKTVSAGNKVVFNGDDVTATVSGSTVTWDYDTHRFWDPSASSYTFFAVLPNDVLVAEGENPTNPYATTGLFSSNDITFDDPTAMDNDILVADKTVVAGTGSAAPYSYTNPVEIKFNHIASNVNLYVKQDSKLGDAVVKVTALSLLNIKNNGKFAVSEYAGSGSIIPTVAWSAPTATATTLGTAGVYEILDAAEASDDVTVAGKTPYTSHAAGTTTGTPAPLFEDYVFMPQTLVADTQKIKLSYTIQVGSEEPNVYTDVEIDIRDFQTTDTDDNSGSDITTWDAKTKYIYTITIGANVIEFTAAVKGWETTVNGYQYLVN